MLGPSLPMDSLKRKRGGNQEEIDQVSLFRRVRIYNSIHRSTPPNILRSDLDYRTKVYEFRNNDWSDQGTGHVNIRLEPKVYQNSLSSLLENTFKKELQRNY